MVHDIKIVGFLVFVVVTTIAAWITAFRMRRRIKKSLGQDVSSAELTSISTWMKVADAEQKKQTTSMAAPWAHRASPYLANTP